MENTDTVPSFSQGRRSFIAHLRWKIQDTQRSDHDSALAYFHPSNGRDRVFEADSGNTSLDGRLSHCCGVDVYIVVSDYFDFVEDRFRAESPENRAEGWNRSAGITIDVRAIEDNIPSLSSSDGRVKTGTKIGDVSICDGPIGRRTYHKDP